MLLAYFLFNYTEYRIYIFSFDLRDFEGEESLKRVPVTGFILNCRFGPYFVEPIVAGLDPKTFEPFICSMDLIGCPNMPEDFIVAGTCTEQLYGMCEALWEPNLEPDDLFETISQALINAVDRDAISGWGAVVHIM